MREASLVVCRSCLSMLRRGPRPDRWTSTAIDAQRWAARRAFLAPTVFATSGSHANTPAQPWLRAHQWARAASSNTPAQATPSFAVDTTQQRIESLSKSLLESDDTKYIPTDGQVLETLDELRQLSRVALNSTEPQAPPTTQSRVKKPRTATASLLGSINERHSRAQISKEEILGHISDKAEEIIRHPLVFISPAVLKKYVELQAMLQQPSSFPDVFDLYARKPLPQASGNGVEYASATPNKISNAIDPAIATAALTSAIHSRDLVLATDIIATTFSTPAFKRAKILRQAGIPIAGFAMAPAVAYALSTQFSALQQTMDPGTATTMAFAGIMTYVGAVGMVGYVAVTTANDQMDRVTWASGVPLWERWIREEERAAIDQIASAWGFKDAEKRGDEEGSDWDSLREWTGLRGMVLDKVSLLEGMQ